VEAGAALHRFQEDFSERSETLGDERITAPVKLRLP